MGQEPYLTLYTTTPLTSIAESTSSSLADVLDPTTLSPSDIRNYTPRSLEGIIAETIKICFDIGFSPQHLIVNEDGSEHKKPKIQLIYDDMSVSFAFDLSEDRDPVEAMVLISGLSHGFYPRLVPEDHSFSKRMDALFELVCRLAVTLDADYLPLMDRPGPWVLPEGRPIAENVESIPRYGVYSENVLEDFGGLEAIYPDQPWYTADIDGDRTFVIESEDPWAEGGWEPPTQADYLVEGTFHDQSQSLGVSDPFAQFRPGEYGTDVGVHFDDIAEEFTNDTLECVRVYVDDNYDLRRVDDDSFVRNIVAADTDDTAEFIQQMQADPPADATEDDQLSSALIHEAIPPWFARLDDPDDDNVVTKIMSLDIDTNKYELLVSLGADTHHPDFDDEERQAMETVVDNLTDLEDVPDIDEYIQQKLL